MVPPVSSVPSQGRQPLEAKAPDPAWRALHQCCLADLSALGAAVESVCPVTAIPDSGSNTSTMSENVVAKLQAAVPDVQIVGLMTDDQYVKIADGEL